MSDDNDDKSDAMMKHVKAKDISVENKMSTRPDKQLNGKSLVIVKPNCGCNQPCGCERVCGCIHNCYLNKYNVRHPFYHNTSHTNCSDHWVSDYSGAGFGGSIEGGVNCLGGAITGNASPNGDSLGGVSMNDCSDHITHMNHSYVGTSPYFDSYEKQRARKMMAHYVADGVFF